jgi:hypothetical protein
MEMAIKDKVSFEMCEKRFGKRRKNQQDYSLVDRIAVAKQEGLFDDEIAQIATNIRLRGNVVLHNDPNVKEKVTQTILETVRVIKIVTSGKDIWGTPDWLK